jgi:hypothetical protein
MKRVERHKKNYFNYEKCYFGKVKPIYHHNYHFLLYEKTQQLDVGNFITEYGYFYY